MLFLNLSFQLKSNAPFRFLSVCNKWFNGYKRRKTLTFATMLKSCLKALFVLFVGFARGEIAQGNGTFKLDGIFSITDGNHVNVQSGFMMMQAMKFAVETVNAYDLLHGYKLGVNTIYDANSSKQVREDILSSFKAKVPFVIGPYSSETSYIASILTGTFAQIAISYSATYSDFDRASHSEEFMLRTVPSDKFRVQVAYELVKKLGWNYLAVISSYSYDGEGDARHFIGRLPESGICLDEQIDLPNTPSKDNYEETIDKLSILMPGKLRKGVVLFTNKRDSRELFSIIQTRGMGERFVIICLYGCTSYIDVISGNEESLNGTLSIDIAYDEMPGFEEYYTNLKPDKDSPDYFKRVWEKVFDCSLDVNNTKNPCTGKEKFSVGNGYYRNTPVHTVMNAVYVIGDAMQVFTSRICNKTMPWMTNQSKCVLDPDSKITYSNLVHSMLLRISYNDGTLEDFRTPYDRINRTIKYEIRQLNIQNGFYENELKGYWQISRPDLNSFPEDVNLTHKKPIFKLDHNPDISINKTGLVPRIICSEQCPAGYIPIRDANILKAKCCWSCEKCKENSISMNESCVQCAATEMVVKNRCHSLPEVRAQISGDQDDRLFVIFVILLVVGFGFVVFVTLLFVYFNDNAIVRCSGRDLCYMILIGLAMLFLCPVAYMVQPSVGACVFRGALPGMAFLMCYAPLFLRTSRIHRIFVHAKTSVALPALTSPQSQILVVFVIVCVQVLLSSVWFASKTPVPVYIISEKREYITLQCKGDASAVSMFTNLALSFLFMVFCTVLAFKTRNFPKNYNEAKFIGVTLYITCVIWAVFLPAYYLTPTKGLFLQEYLISALCITVGYVTLFGLFGKKVRLLLCPRRADKKCHSQQMWSFSHSHESPHVEMNGTATHV